MNLALFDIDGTLLRSTAVDDHCYARAVTEVFGIAGFSTDWMDYPYSTDSGIVGELVRRHRGRDPSGEELERFREHFFGLLKAAVEGRPESIAVVPGSAALIGVLESSGRWRAAIATGTWRRAAVWKLALAGIDPDGLALATADDARDRAEIVLTAIRRAVQPGQPGGVLSRRAASGRQAGASNCMPTPAAPVKACHPGRRAVHGSGGVPPEKIVYVGDAPWDFRTARRLGLGFVGVAADGDRKRLGEAGVEHVVSDFSQPDRVVELLETAAREPAPAVLAALAGQNEVA
jgi:phosphoglycolate phosphatase-like HAD superfamily hydrolase